jgi:hypothetical protein
MEKSILALILVAISFLAAGQTHIYTTVYNQEFRGGSLTDKQFLGGVQVTVKTISAGNYKVTFHIPGGPTDPVVFKVSYMTEYYEGRDLYYAYSAKDVYGGKVQLVSTTKLSTMAAIGSPAQLIVGMSNGFTHLYTLSNR